MAEYGEMMLFHYGHPLDQPPDALIIVADRPGLEQVLVHGRHLAGSRGKVRHKNMRITQVLFRDSDVRIPIGVNDWNRVWICVDIVSNIAHNTSS